MYHQHGCGVQSGSSEASGKLSRHATNRPGINRVAQPVACSVETRCKVAGDAARPRRFLWVSECHDIVALQLRESYTMHRTFGPSINPAVEQNFLVPLNRPIKSCRGVGTVRCNPATLELAENCARVLTRQYIRHLPSLTLWSSKQRYT